MLKNDSDRDILLVFLIYGGDYFVGTRLEE